MGRKHAVKSKGSCGGCGNSCLNGQRSDLPPDGYNAKMGF